MTARIRINLSYDGSDYFGWQVQPARRTIQETLEKALSRLYSDKPIRVYAAGRTDRGVHAVGQVVHYCEKSSRDIKILKKALKAILPPDIRVWEIRKVEDDFHARFKARQRTYTYRVLEHSDLFARRFAWFPDRDYDLNQILQISGYFKGKFDFRRFSTSPDPEESSICDIKSIRFFNCPNGYVIQIKADRFLRRMVRTLVGTLIDTASGRIPEENITRALRGEDVRVGVPAPAQGLALFQVKYDHDQPQDIPPDSPWSFKDEIIY